MHPYISSTNTNPLSSGRQPNHDVSRISARIRSLQDDVIQQRESNKQLQSQNMRLMQIVNELTQEMEYIAESTRNVKQHHLLSSTQLKQRQLQEIEAQCKAVSSQMQHLNDIIKIKSQQYASFSYAKTQLQQVRYSHQQQNNALSFHSNAMHSHLSHIILNIIKNGYTAGKGELQSQTLPGKARRIQELIAVMQQQHSNGIKQCESIKKEGKNSLLAEKEKRVKLEYQCKLLIERRKDKSKQQSYTKCYSENSIHLMLESMLATQNQLNAKLIQLTSMLNNLKERRESNESKNVGTSPNKIEDELMAMHSSLHSLLYTRNELYAKYIQIEGKLNEARLQQEKCQLLSSRRTNGINSEMADTLQEENALLERQVLSLADQVQLLQKQCSI